MSLPANHPWKLANSQSFALRKAKIIANRRYQKKRYASLHEDGMCYCGRALEEGKSQCEHCRATNREKPKA